MTSLKYCQSTRWSSVNVNVGWWCGGVDRVACVVGVEEGVLSAGEGVDVSG